MMTIEEQLAEFAGLGDVFDPATATDAAVAAEVADVMMAPALTGGSLAMVNGLNRVLRILRLVVKLVTERRNREAYVANAFWSYKKLAEYLDDAVVSTVQKWCEAGRAAIEAQDVSRETSNANSGR